MKFITFCLACLVAGFFLSAHAETVSTSDAIGWAREQQQKKSLVEQTLTSAIKNIQTKSRTNVSDVAWAKQQLSKPLAPIPINDKATSTIKGVDIDALIKRYAIPMRFPNEREQSLYIFVSFSMTEQSLKALLTQAQQAHGVLVIRGLVNGSLKDTTQTVAKLLDGKQGGLQIDPSPFKKFNISQVPAVVVIDKNCTDIVYGDISLSDSLEAIEQSGDCKAQAKQFLTTLRPSL
jgi:type-F conjugative transfer system pilin assembly protein TrbC